MVQLTVNRKPSANEITLGELLWNGIHECWTCEDKIREIPGQPVAAWKVYGKTAIPSGTYKVEIGYSSHFKKPMPHVLDVPGFDHILIHIGNTPGDTLGCLLLGRGTTNFGVSMSTLAFNAFFEKLIKLPETEEVWITYNNPTPVQATAPQHQT